jgi:hypothetical protein
MSSPPRTTVARVIHLGGTWLVASEAYVLANGPLCHFKQDSYRKSLPWMVFSHPQRRSLRGMVFLVDQWIISLNLTLNRNKPRATPVVRACHSGT